MTRALRGAMTVLMTMSVAACGGSPTAPTEVPVETSNATANSGEAGQAFDVAAAGIFSFSAQLQGSTSAREELVIPIPEGLIFTPAPALVSARQCEASTASGGECLPEGHAGSGAALAGSGGGGRSQPGLSLSVDGGGIAPSTAAPNDMSASRSSEKSSSEGSSARVPGSAGTDTSSGASSPVPDTSVPVRAGAVLGRFSVVKPLTDAARGTGVGTVVTSQVRQLSERAGPVSAPVDGAFSYGGDRLVLRRRLMVVGAPVTSTQMLRFATGTVSATATFPSALGERTSTCLALAMIAPAKAEDRGQAVCALPDFSGTVTNLSASVRLTNSSTAPVVSVPEIYLRQDGDRKNVIVTRVRPDGGSEQVPVVVGLGDGVRRVILTGLSAGDRVRVGP